MTRTATMVACCVQHWLARLCWARQLFTFARLQGGFLIQTEQPDSCLQEGTRLTIGVEHRTSALQEGDGIVDMLPGVIAPRAETFGFEPATHRAGRDARKAGILGHTTGQFGATPARERYLALPGQATSD